jgi:hypothetical protein
MLEQLKQMIAKMGLSTDVGDYAFIAFIILWFVLLFLPLNGIDRRDKASGMVYALYMAGAGVALLLALPQNYVEQKPDVQQQMTMIFALMIISLWRWGYSTTAAEAGSK